MKSRTKNKNNIMVFLFLLPSLALLAVFVLWPMIYSIVLSFYDWSPLKGMSFLGLDNYKELFTDKLWWKSIFNTLYYVVLNVPLIICASLALASLVLHTRFSKLFRGIFFLPTMLSLVATGIVWNYLLSTNNGAVNGLLNAIGLSSVKWFTSGKVAMISIVIVTVWRWAGYYMVMIIAGMLNVSTQYYEAASLEGATSWQKFRYITLPELKTILIFIALMSIIGSFQEFDLFYMITSGGPGTATYVTGYYMYQQAFSSMNMGYSSAMAVFLFVVILFFTIIQNKVTSDE